MRQRACTRYYCDFCKKAGLSSFHMRKHEAGCTKNPGRVCLVCSKLLQQEQPKLAELITLLPDVHDYIVTSDWGYSYVDSEAIEPALARAEPGMRALAGRCPHCILAALRQSGIPATLATWLNVKEEMNNIFTAINMMDESECEE